MSRRSGRSSPRLTDMTVGIHCIKRLRWQLGLECHQKKKFKATTDSNHALQVTPTLLDQSFAADAPNTVWIADTTTDEDWLYLTAFKDMCICEIVGNDVTPRMTQSLAGRALCRAVTTKRPPKGLIHHSGHGSQFYSKSYRKLFEEFGIFC